MPLGTSTYCCRCRTKLSITSCEGCQEKFCNNCFNEHRTALSNEFENLVNFRNQIVEIINRPSSSTTASSDSCFEKINRWETEMQKKIADIAAKARAQAQQCTPQSDRNIRSELDRISSDLQQKQKTNDYLEGDIIQIRRQLQMLNDMVERFNNQIRIDTSNSNKVDWNSLLTVTRDNTNQSDQIPMPTPPPSYSSIFSSHNNVLRNSVPIPHHQTYSTGPSYQPMPSPYHDTSSNRQNSSNDRRNERINYVCIGCKTKNQFFGNGPHYCVECHFLARP